MMNFKKEYQYNSIMSPKLIGLKYFSPNTYQVLTNSLFLPNGKKSNRQSHI